LYPYQIVVYHINFKKEILVSKFVQNKKIRK
jgi:hypothetical protein